jgi:glycosyltransferase involved in cell wall biosynthesis
VPGATGWLVPPSNPAALATAINEALSLSFDERQRLAQHTIAHVASRFSREVMCARTIEVYEELLFPQPAEVGVAA